MSPALPLPGQPPRINLEPEPQRTGRPPLDRYRADVVLVVELGALDEDDATSRLEDLLGELRPRLTRAVRNAGARRGNPQLVEAYALDNPSAV